MASVFEFSRQWGRPISNFVRDERGATAIIFALVSLPMLMMVGAGVDYGRMIAARNALQTSTDAAALAVAAAATKSQTDRITFGTNALAGTLSGTRNLTLSGTPSISITGDNVDVSASATLPLFFGQLLGFSSATIRANANSVSSTMTSSATYGRACLLAKQTSGDGIYTNSSTLTANCGLYANSGSGNGFDINGTSAISSTFSCVAGNYDKDSSTTVTPLPKTGCVTMDDPFTALAAPTNAAASCDFTGKKARTGDTLSPGVYCSGLEVESNATVTFNAGTYIIRDGQFKIGSGATATGTNVLFYLTGSNSVFDFGSSASVRFKGLTDGDRKGMVIWNPSINSSRHKFGCGSASYLEGGIYSPNTEVEIGSNGAANASADWTVWVVKRLQMGSSSALTINANFSSGATPMPQGLVDGGLRYLLAAGSTSVSGVRLTR